MLQEENDKELREMLQEEVKELEENKIKFEEELKILMLPKDPNDDKNVFIEIRAGAGGDEAALFAAIFQNVYKIC
jgi:peptide chain release factor 1